MPFTNQTLGCVPVFLGDVSRPGDCCIVIERPAISKSILPALSLIIPRSFEGRIWLKSRNVSGSVRAFVRGSNAVCLSLPSSTSCIGSPSHWDRWLQEVIAAGRRDLRRPDVRLLVCRASKAAVQLTHSKGMHFTLFAISRCSRNEHEGGK